MSEKGPFDAAIIYLPWIDSCIPAIRVLDAAGKVDKEDCLEWLEKAFVNIDDIPAHDQIRWLKPGTRKVQIATLLETLPDKEKK